MAYLHNFRHTIANTQSRYLHSVGYQEGELQVANTARGRVPMRGTGASQPVLVGKVL